MRTRVVKATTVQCNFLLFWFLLPKQTENKSHALLTLFTSNAEYSFFLSKNDEVFLGANIEDILGKICRKISFQKKLAFLSFIAANWSPFFGFCGKWKQLNWIFTRRLCKKKSSRNNTKAPSQKPLLLIYQLDSKQHLQMQALLDALRAPWSSASRFLSFYYKFPFVYFETNLQSKRRKTK